MQKTLVLTAGIVAAVALVAPPHAHAADISIKGARRILAAAEARAKALDASGGGAIAITDSGGNVVLVERLDGTFPAAATVSIGKARTAALFRKPTSAFENTINGGRIAMTALPDSLFTPLQGGVPLLMDGAVVGAIGVSGAKSAAQDEEIAKSAASIVLSQE